MSQTVLYAAGADGDFVKVGHIKNAWHGAMYIWTELAKRYLGKDNPFMCFDEIWKLADGERLDDYEYYSLITTFDNAVLPAGRIAKIVSHSLRNFRSTLHEEATGLRGQANIIDDEFAKGAIAIAWNQTSVNSNPWFIYEPGFEEGRPYNLLRDKKHHLIERHPRRGPAMDAVLAEAEKGAPP